MVLANAQSSSGVTHNSQMTPVSDVTTTSREKANSAKCSQSTKTVTCLGEVMLESAVSVARLPEVDETVVLESVQRRLGGGAWNISRHLVDLGHRVRLGALIGKWDAPIFDHAMDSRGIDTSSVVWTDGSSDLLFYFKTLSSYSAIYQKSFVPLDMEARLLPATMGCDMLIFAGSRHTEFRQFYLKTAISSEAPVKVFSPNYSVYEYSPDELRNFLRHVDVLLVNEAEAIFMRSRLDNKDILQLMGREDSLMIMTRGPQGAILYTPGGLTIVPASISIPGDYIGAGDAFAAGFLSALINNIHPIEAARMGSKFASTFIEEAAAMQR